MSNLTFKNEVSDNAKRERTLREYEQRQNLNYSGRPDLASLAQVAALRKESKLTMPTCKSCGNEMKVMGAIAYCGC